MNRLLKENQIPEILSRRVRPRVVGLFSVLGLFVAGSVIVYSKLSADAINASERRELDTFDEALLALNTKLAVVAKEITGKELEVFCIPVDKTGIVVEEGVHAHGAFLPVLPPGRSKLIIDSELCRGIMHVANPNSDIHNTLTMDGDILESARTGIFTIGHELTHAEGVVDENLAECGAIDLFPIIVDKLGLDPEVADVDPANYSIAYNLPPSYEHADC